MSFQCSFLHMSTILVCHYSLPYTVKSLFHMPLVLYCVASNCCSSFNPVSFFPFWQNNNTLRKNTNKNKNLRMLWSSTRYGWRKLIIHSDISSKGKVFKVIIIGPIATLHFTEVSEATLRCTDCSKHFDPFHPRFLISVPCTLCTNEHVSPALWRQKPKYVTRGIILPFYPQILLHLIYICISNVQHNAWADRRYSILTEQHGSHVGLLSFQHCHMNYLFFFPCIFSTYSDFCGSVQSPWLKNIW